MKAISRPRLHCPRLQTTSHHNVRRLNTVPSTSSSWFTDYTSVGLWS